jgi:hypothetical protein
MTDVIGADRAKGIRRLLYVAVACGVLLALFAVIAASSNTRYAVTLGVSAAVLLASAGLTLRALPGRGAGALRGAIVTGALMLLLALPAVQIWVGLLMAVCGVGILFVALSKEVEPR